MAIQYTIYIHHEQSNLVRDCRGKKILELLCIATNQPEKQTVYCHLFLKYFIKETELHLSQSL